MIQKDPTYYFINKDVTTHLLTFLDLNSLARCQQLNKKWYELTNNEHLWRSLLKPKFPEVSKFPTEIIVKQCVVTTMEQVIERIEKFIESKTIDNKKHALTCIFEDKELFIKVNFGYYKIDTEKEKEKEIDTEEFIIFTGIPPVTTKYITTSLSRISDVFGLTCKADVSCRLFNDDDVTKCINFAHSLEKYTAKTFAAHIRNRHTPALRKTGWQKLKEVVKHLFRK